MVGTMHETVRIIDMTEKQYAEYVQDEIRKQVQAVKKGINHDKGR